MTKVIIRVGRYRASNEGGAWSSDDPTLARFLNAYAGPDRVPAVPYTPDRTLAVLALARAAIPSAEEVLVRVDPAQPGVVY